MSQNLLTAITMMGTISDDMSRLNPEKLHVDFMAPVTPEVPVVPRRYTLTHSDVTGDLYLTIGADYNRTQFSGLYTRLMRDEVVAEWGTCEQQEKPSLSLHIHCHVSGGLVFGTARFRDEILHREMPLVLESIRYGDRRFFETNPALDEAPILVHFHSTRSRYDRIERWGVAGDWRVARDDWRIANGA